MVLVFDFHLTRDQLPLFKLSFHDSFTAAIHIIDGLDPSTIAASVKAQPRPSAIEEEIPAVRYSLQELRHQKISIIIHEYPYLGWPTLAVEAAVIQGIFELEQPLIREKCYYRFLNVSALLN